MHFSQNWNLPFICTLCCAIRFLSAAASFIFFLPAGRQPRHSKSTHGTRSQNQPQTHIILIADSLPEKTFLVSPSFLFFLPYIFLSVILNL